MFIVRWALKARDRLADIWIHAADRSAITAAANEIDRRLSREPLEQGESRENGRRLLTVSPLCVIFKVRKPRNEVRVLSVWEFKTRRHRRQS